MKGVIFKGLTDIRLTPLFYLEASLSSCIFTNSWYNEVGFNLIKLMGMIKYAYFNGEIISEEEVKINFNDLGFARGYAVFDAMKTVKRQPFLIKSHFRRLQNSAKLLNINFKMILSEFVQIIEQLLDKNQNAFSSKKELTIKTTVTGGVSTNGIEMDGEATIIITIGDLSLVEPKEKLYNLGIKTILVDFQRIIPEAKTTNYLMAIKNQERKKESRAMEIIYQHKNLLLEGATSNIFIVKDGTIITPMRNILSGTMRNLIIKLLKKEGVIVETRDVMMSETFNADEIFLTGTFKNILPVRQIDDRMIGDGQVGKITKKAIKLLKKYIEDLYTC